jgi:hypothetical protein
MAYISSLFPNITKWKYIDHPENVNPFQSAIDLWRAGYVPSFDGKRWRLHTGKNAKVIYELSKAGEVKNQPPDLTAGEFNRGE